MSGKYFELKVPLNLQNNFDSDAPPKFSATLSHNNKSVELISSLDSKIIKINDLIELVYDSSRLQSDKNKYVAHQHNAFVQADGLLRRWFYEHDTYVDTLILQRDFHEELARNNSETKINAFMWATKTFYKFPPWKSATLMKKEKEAQMSSTILYRGIYDHLKLALRSGDGFFEEEIVHKELSPSHIKFWKQAHEDTKHLAQRLHNITLNESKIDSYFYKLYFPQSNFLDSLQE